MTEISHSHLAETISKAADGSLPGSFLIHGQEMLVEQAAESLVAKLVNGVSRDLCLEVMDGLVEKIPDLLAQMSTFSMMCDRKIVIFKDAKLFEGRGGHDRLVGQIIEAFDNENSDLAAKSLNSLCSSLEIDHGDVVRNFQTSEPLRMLHDHMGSDGIDTLVQRINALGMRPAGDSGHLETLQMAVEKGFANHHHLLITVNSRVPKNLKFYKSFNNHGWIIDCNVPMGERRADRMAQEGVLRQSLEATLSATGKHLQHGLFETLCKLTGFDLRTFTQNVQKLVDFTGQRKEITSDDVHKLLRRTKSDPIFELTNAVADRNLKQALFYLHHLLNADWYPLQILSALTNQIRRLVIAKDFTMSSQGKNWNAGMGYAQFQNVVMPAIAAFDGRIQETSGAWMSTPDDRKKGKPDSSNDAKDIALAPNPKNPYPVFQTLSKSEKFTLQELLAAMSLLNDVDLRLKSTGQDAAMVLKKTVIEICRPIRT